MAFLTDRKRANGMGSAHSGVHHHWSMILSSSALLFLVPLFIFTFGPILGEPHDVVVAYFARPFPAIVAGLTIVAGLMHYKNGVLATIEDYTSGSTRQVLIILSTCLCYAAAATGLFAIARIAL